MHRTARRPSVRHAAALLALAAAPFAALASPYGGGLDPTPVVEAERAFAARARVVDPRDAFVEHFAPDAIVFNAGPGPAFPGLSEGPPWGIDIRWRPSDAGLARSGDFGWTTGPAEYRRSRDAAPYRWGHYTSVWQKQADGAWKVIADIGVDTPVPTSAIPDWTPAPLGTAERQRGVGAAAVPWTPHPYAPSPEWQQDGLLARDRALALRAARDARSAAAAFRETLTADARVHRDGQPPAIGRNAALGALRDGDATLAWSPQGARIAPSGDLGFTYGSGSKRTTTGPVAFDYLAIWERRDGGWKIRVLVQRTPPAPAKPAG